MSLSDRILRQHAIMRRALAVLLVFLMLLVVWIAVIVPARALALSQTRWRIQARHHLAGDKGRASAESALREQLRALPGAPVWSRFYPSRGASADTALRTDLMRLTASAGVTVQSLATLPTEEDGALRRHGMRIDASMTIGQLEHLATELHTHARYLRVERLTISAPIVQAPHTNPTLVVRMVVYGYSVMHQGSSG